MKQAATLKDVADAAGVSIRTAGRALRNDGPVKAQVAERVRAAARELKYVPNAAARSLRSRSSRIIGAVIGANSQTEAGQRRLALLESTLREQNFHILIGALPTGERALNTLLRDWAGIVEQVIFLGWNPAWNAELLEGLPQRFLFFDCAVPAEKYDFVRTDRASGAAAAVTALIASGRRRIAHVFNRGAQGRLAGVGQAAAAEKLRIIPIESVGLELKDGFEAGAAIVAAGADAAFFDTDRMALGFYRYAHEHGISIPGEIAVAGFDDDSAGAYAIPTLTTVAHPDREAVRSVVDWVTDRERAPVRKVFPSRLIRRESIPHE